MVAGSAEEYDDPTAYTTESKIENASTWSDDSVTQDWLNNHEPPAIITGDPGQADAVTVNTEALRTYIANINILIPYLKDVKTEIEGLTMAAGAFPHAEDLVTRTLGSSTGSTTSARGITITLLTEAIDGLTACARELEKLAALYERTEDDSKLNADKLYTYIQNAQGYINKVTGATLPAPETDISEYV